MQKDLQFYTNQTIASWNEVADRHKLINKNLPHEIKAPSFNNLNPDFNDLIDSIHLDNKSVVQVCCNNGIDLISLKNKGAGYCLGIDGSQSFIEQANALSKLTEHRDIEFICSDIYDLPSHLSGQFDVVLMTVGVINWMPDLYAFITVCAQLLKKGGLIIMEEIHPILGMYEEGKPSYLAGSYFERNPYRDESGLDYFTNEKYQAKPNFWFQHTLSDLMTSAIQTGLTLKHFKEISYNVGNYCEDLQHIKANPPLAMNLLWQK